MDPKNKVFSLKIVLAIIVGTVSGILNLSPAEGLSLYIFTFFLAVPISLKAWGSELGDMGLMKIYREGAGSSFLALLMFWTISLTLFGGGPVILFVNTNYSSGVYNLEFRNGTAVPPNLTELSGYNCINLSLSNSKVVAAYLGICGIGEGKYLMRDILVSVRGDSISIQMNSSAYDVKDNNAIAVLLKGVNLSVKENYLIINGIKIKDGESSKVTINSTEFNVRFKNYRIILFSQEVSVDEISSTPLGNLLEVIKAKKGYNVFDKRVARFKERTIRINERAYVIVKGD